MIELQTSVDGLTAKRDQAYEEMRTARAKTEALRDLIAQQRAALAHPNMTVDLAAIESAEGEDADEHPEAPTGQAGAGATRALLRRLARPA